MRVTILVLAGLLAACVPPEGGGGETLDGIVVIPDELEVVTLPPPP